MKSWREKLLIQIMIQRPHLIKVVLGLSGFGHALLLIFINHSSAVMRSPVLSALYDTGYPAIWISVFATYALIMFYAMYNSTVNTRFVSAIYGTFLWGFMVCFNIAVSEVPLGPLVFIYGSFFIASLWAAVAFYEERILYKASHIDYSELLTKFMNEQIINVRKSHYDSNSRKSIQSCSDDQQTRLHRDSEESE